MSNNPKPELEDLLVIGARVRFGEKFAKDNGFRRGRIVKLIKGYFEYDNGLYCETQTAPSIRLGKDDYQSIYHLFGNNLERFMDCEVVESNSQH